MPVCVAGARVGVVGRLVEVLGTVAGPGVGQVAEGLVGVDPVILRVHAGQPPATAGMMEISDPSGTAVPTPSR